METSARVIPASFAFGALIAAAMLFINPATAFAQDVKFVIFPNRTMVRGEPVTPATFATEMSEANLVNMPDLSTYGYMNVTQTVDEQGVIQDAGQVSFSTSPEISKAFPLKVRKTIQFTPAELNGTPIKGQVRYTLIYNPSNAPETGPDAAPRLLNVIPMLVNKTVWTNINDRKDVVWLKVTIDATGAMTKSILHEKQSAWAAPIQDVIYSAVRHWEFAPARHDGKPVAADISLPARVVPTAMQTASILRSESQSAAAPGRAGFLFSSRQVQASPYVPGRDTSVVGLPTYVVTGTRTLPKPESWYYAKLPNIEVLSDVSKFSTDKFLDDFQRLQIALRIVWPELMDEKARLSTLLVLCGSAGAYDALKPRRSGSNSIISTSGFVTEDSERTAIVMDYNAYGVPPNLGLRAARDPYRMFYENYARFLIRRSTAGTRIPAWFETGLAALISTIDFTNKYVEFAKIDPDIFLTRGSNRRSFYLMPLENMFSSNGRQHGSTWRPQCYEFVHMCLYGAREKYQKPFAQFLQIACNRDVTEDDFKKCFGCSYDEMLIEMRGYLGYAAHKSLLFKPEKGGEGMPQPAPVNMREATQGEIGRIKGEVFRLGGNPSEAANAEIDAYMRGERDPALLASLGLAEYEAKREDRAVRFLEAATKAGVERPRAYLTLAQIRFKRETSGADEALKLDANQLQSVLAPLSVALRQPPPMPETYTLIGNAWLDSETAPTKEEMGVVLEGVRQFPANAELVYSAASLCARLGDSAAAANLIKLGQQITTAPQAMRDKFAALQASLPAAGK